MHRDGTVSARAEWPTDCSRGWGDADLGGAVAIYDGPADLLAHFDESVLA